MANSCSQDTERITVVDEESTRHLAEAVTCSGPGSFEVVWTGRVQTDVTIFISNGTFLNISGFEGAVIDGEEQVQLFNVSSASLYMSGLTLENGYADVGGAVSASSSEITIVDCNLTGNTAVRYGGAISVDNTMLVLEGTNYFRSNSAEIQGGAIRGSNSSVIVGGTSTFEHNMAIRGGAITTIHDSRLNLTGESIFRNNTGTTSGGGIFGIYSTMNASGSGGSSIFEGNSAGAEFGGGIYWRGEDETDGISIEMPFEMVNNSAPTGGAIYLSGNGLQVLVNNIHFKSNTASKNGGALVTHVVGLRDSTAVVQGCMFQDNTAEVSGGAVIISAGFVTFRDCIYEGNVAGDSGGAVLSDGGYTVSGFNLIQSELSYNQASTGPAIAQIGNTEDNAARNVAFADVTFMRNTLLCGNRQFLNENSSNVPSVGPDSTYATSCAFCADFSECCNCTVIENDTVAFCTDVLEHTSSPSADGTLASLHLDGGYWRTSNVSLEILECYNPDACVGGVAEACGDVYCEKGYCAEGYTGPYCAVCEAGYTWGQGHTCYECSGVTARAAESMAIALILLAAILLFGAWRYLTSVTHGSTREQSRLQECLSRVKQVVPFQAIKILIVAWQIITEFTSVANISFPAIYGGLLRILEVVNLDLTWILSLGCHFDTNFYHRLLAITIAPLVLLGILAIAFWFARRRYAFHADRMAEIRRKHISGLILITFLVYSSASSTVFQTFACDELDDGYLYLRADYRLRCHRSSGLGDDRHFAYMVYAVCMVFVYPLGIPAIYGIILYKGWKYRHVRPRVRDQSTLGAWPPASDTALENEALECRRQRAAQMTAIMVGDLCEPYKADRYYYEVVECIRRVMLTGVVVFIFPDSAAQISTTFLLALVFYAISEALNPYESTHDCWTYRYGQLVVLLSLFVALLLKVDLSDETTAGEYVFSLILAVSNVVLTVAVFGESVLSMYSFLKESD